MSKKVQNKQKKQKSIEQYKRDRLRWIVTLCFAVFIIIFVAYGVYSIYNEFYKKDTKDKVTELAENKHALPLGDEHAKVEVIAFTDFKCIHCRDFHKQAKDELQSYIDDGDVQMRTIQHPLLGDKSEKFATMADAITKHNLKNVYWEYTDEAYDDFNESNPIKVLDETKISKDDKKDVIETYNKEKRKPYNKVASENIGINATPTVFVNGHFVSDIDDLEDYVKRELYE